MVIGIIAGAVVLFLILVIAIGYVKAPPDTAYIVSGLRHKVVIGKACIKIPLLERLDKLTLKLIPIDVKTSSAVPTADYININVDAAVNIKVSGEESKLHQATQNFLNVNSEYIADVAREVLEGNMREIVGRMALKEMVSDRQKFAELVKQNAEPDLAAMGLDIISFNVQNFRDGNGVIDDLGIDNISQIKKGAAIAKATADKEVAIAQANADKEANDARVDAQKVISERNTELAMRQFDLKKSEDSKKAEADAAYAIQQEEQRKIVEVSKANADIAAQERAIVLKEAEAKVQEQSLDASIKKQADADLYRRKKEADARKYEEQAVAEAQLYTAKQEAEAIKEKGIATAEAIRQQGIAEAEAMEKKAEAYQKYGAAAVAEMIVGILPEMAREVSAPLEKIDRITLFGGADGASGVGNIASNVPTVMAQTFETVKAATGVDMASIVNASSYDAKVNRNVNVSGLPDCNDCSEFEVMSAEEDLPL